MHNLVLHRTCFGIPPYEKRKSLERENNNSSKNKNSQKIMNLNVKIDRGTWGGISCQCIKMWQNNTIKSTNDIVGKKNKYKGECSCFKISKTSSSVQRKEKLNYMSNFSESSSIKKCFLFTILIFRKLFIFGRIWKF